MQNDWLELLVQPHGFCLANFDPTLTITHDLANLGVCFAYVFGFPFCAWRMVAMVPRELFAHLGLLVAFVYACGVGHFFKVLTAHAATYELYMFVVAWDAFTAFISWAFVLAIFDATRRLGLRMVQTDGGR